MNDTKVLTTLSVLLGINLEATGDEDMDTAPPPTRKVPRPRSETQKPQAKVEKMDEDISPEKQEVGWMMSVCRMLPFFEFVLLNKQVMCWKILIFF